MNTHRYCRNAIAFCRYRNCFRRAIIFSKVALRTIHSASRKNYTQSSIPLSFDRIWPCFAVLSSCIGNYKLVTTKASDDEQEVKDEDLDRILIAVEQDPVSGKVTCIAFIENLCRSGNLSVAARLLQGLRDKQIFLSPKTYNFIIAEAGERNQFDLLSQIFKDLLVSRKFLIGQDSYSNLAKALLKSADSVPLLKIVREVADLTFPKTAIVVINRIISVLAKSGQMDKALLIFDHMKDLNCKPDIVTYNTVLSILGQAGRVDEMLLEFASMKEANMIPDIFSYNTLINSLRKMGRFESCLVFLREMVEGGLEPDLLTFTALIEGFGRSGQPEEALRLVREMKKKGVCPSIYNYRSLISNFKKIGKFELAMCLEAEMNSSTSDLVGPEDFKRNRR